MYAQNFLDLLIPTALFLSGILGLLAIVSPRCFVRTAAACSRWVDSERLLRVFDRRIDVDHWMLPHSRALGALVVLSVLLLGYFWIAI